MQISESAVREALTALKKPGELFEIRVLAGKNCAMSAYFTDIETAISTMKATPVWKGSQIYFTINQIMPECFSREQHNCFLENVATTTDNDISLLTTLMIDCDPVRRRGISATEEERGYAREVAQSVVNFTRDWGWPEPIQAMSGNGYHCLYDLDPLPNTPENVDLIKKVLQTFNQQFGTPKCEVDEVNFNPARVSKLYGSLAQKGYNSDDRPHRMSKVILVPDVREKVSKGQLEAFAQLWKDPNPCTKQNARKMARSMNTEPREVGHAHDNPDGQDTLHKSCRKYGITDLGEYLDSLNIGHAKSVPYKTGRKWILDKCVFDEGHLSPDAAVFQFADGLLTYRCLHNSCKNQHFAQFIQKVDPNRYIASQKPEKAPITIEDLEDEYEERGVSLRLNQVTHEIEVVSDNPDLDYPSLITTTHSFLKGTRQNLTGVNFDTLYAYSDEIAKKSKYNPVLEFLTAVEHDGHDHLPDLFALMHIPDDDDLSRQLIRKWFLQGIALLHNTESSPISAEGVLTLQGPQGCGKTSLVERFAIRPEWFARGSALNTNDKDTLRRACSRWIIELGEVETTLRSDIEALKNFITNDVDVYRVPYGRTDLKYARRSNLAATCNSDKYLLDQTGNRRWWTVPIDEFIKYSDIQSFPIEQVWAQSLQFYQAEGPDCFRLTGDERDALNDRNSKALKPMKAEDEVRDVLKLAEVDAWKFAWVDITITAWKSHFDALKNINSGMIGKVLSKLQIQQRSTGNSRLYRLPVWKGAASEYQQSNISLIHEENTG